MNDYRQPKPSRLGYIILALAAAWTLATVISLHRSTTTHQKAVVETARQVALTHFNKDRLYLRWAASHKGACALLTEAPQSMGKERGLAAPAARSQSFTDPSRAMHQVDAPGGSHQMAGHLTSLNPVRPENKPDPWETKALQAFEQGADEFFEVVSLGGQNFLRLMRPLLLEESCLSCHDRLDYQEGMTRGGLSITVPLSSFMATQKNSSIPTWIALVGLWFLGLCGIGFTFVGLRRRITEREVAEKALLDYEAQYKQLFEKNPLPMWVYDLETLAFLSVNEAAVRHYGYSEAEFFSMTIKDIRPKEEIPALIKNVSAVTEGRDEAGTWKHLKKDGTPIDVEIISHTIRFMGRRAELVLAHDVTAQKRTEAALVESEKHFRLLFENAPVSYQSLDIDGNLLDVNQAWLDMLGYSKDEVVGRWVGDFLAPGYEESFKENFPLFMAAGVIRGEEFELLHKDGSSVLISVDGEVARDPNENSIRTHCILHNITDRRRAEETLRIYEHIVSATNDLMAFVDRNYVYQAVNDAYLKRYKKSRPEVLGRTIADLRGREVFNTAVKELLDQAFAGGQIHYEAWFQYPELGKRYMDVHYYPFHGQDQSVAGVVVNVRDITRRKKMEDDLRQAQKMEAVGTLAGGIAHDFNNILNAILGYTELTMLETDKNSPAYQNLAEVERAGKRAAELIKQILTFSRQTEHQHKPLLLQIVIKEALRLLRSTLPTTIEIRQNIDEECRPVLADVSQVHQVIMNLGTNAYHAMRDQGGLLDVNLTEMQVSSELAAGRPGLRTGRYARLTVSDTGQGMDRETLERIFEPYFTTKKKGEGTGLGLATVHGIVKNHQGVITVRSLPGRGSIFDVYLPVLEVAVSAQPESEPMELPAVSGRVLLVDDEEMIVKMGSNALHRAGCSVEAFSDSTKAFEAFQAEPDGFDVVITDQTMPGLTGFELSRKILAIRPDIPIILATGFSEAVDEKRVKAEGIRDFIMKPLTIYNLVNAVRQALNVRQS